MRPNWHSLREYEALRAMIIAGTTTAAGRYLGISQSAVSRAIGKLESRLERRLFVRQDGRMQPTAEAIALNETLDPIFDSLNRIDGAERFDKKQEVLRIAAAPTIAHRFLQSRISLFLERYSDINVNFEICASDALIGGIAEERIDIGVTDNVTRHSGVKITPFRRSWTVCAMPLDHPLGEKDVIRPEDLEGQPVVAITKRHSVRNWADGVMFKAGVRPKIILETATNVSAIEFVRSGLGVTLLNPFPVSLSVSRNVTLRKFEPALEFRTCFMMPANRPHSAAMRAFMRHVRATIPDDDWSEAY